VNRFFGDAMMIHDAITPLRAAGLPLVYWGPAWVVELFEASANVVATVADTDRKYSPLQAGRMLRSHRPASLIAFPKSARPHAAGFLARIPKRLGCSDGGVGLLCTHSIAFYKQDSPFVERYASVVRRAFADLKEEPSFLPFRPRPTAFTAQEIQAKEFTWTKEYVIFAPGANSGSKRLSTTLFAALGRRLQAQGLGVVILGAGAEDQRLAQLLMTELPEALNLVDRCPLSLSAAWICSSKALVGMDSGLAHVAAGAGIPTLSVFGPTRPRHSKPWGPRSVAIRKEDLDCLECMTFHCPKPDHPCMNMLSLDLLWRELSKLMEAP
jgi:heptosyltransferase II